MKIAKGRRVWEYDSGGYFKHCGEARSYVVKHKVGYINNAQFYRQDDSCVMNDKKPGDANCGPGKWVTVRVTYETFEDDGKLPAITTEEKENGCY